MCRVPRSAVAFEASPQAVAGAGRMRRGIDQHVIHRHGIEVLGYRALRCEQRFITLPGPVAFGKNLAGAEDKVSRA